jgi:CheY-like chemotaxis protein
VSPRVLVVQQRPDVDDVEWAVAPDGETAVAQLREEPFDAVLVDLSLHVLDGWYLLATVGGWDQRPRLVATTSSANDRDRARKLGADTCIDPHEMRRAVFERCGSF